jgi:hypothetical protein
MNVLTTWANCYVMFALFVRQRTFAWLQPPQSRVFSVFCLKAPGGKLDEDG